MMDKTYNFQVVDGYFESNNTNIFLSIPLDYTIDLSKDDVRILDLLDIVEAVLHSFSATTGFNKLIVSASIVTPEDSGKADLLKNCVFDSDTFTIKDLHKAHSDMLDKYNIDPFLGKELYKLDCKSLLTDTLFINEDNLHIYRPEPLLSITIAINSPPFLTTYIER